MLRDPSGERALEPETLVAFQSGPDGAHTFDEPGRVTPRVRTPPPTTERTAPRAFHVSEDDVALWRTSLGLQPLILQRLVRQRAWSVSTIRAFELGIDGDRITIPVRNPYHQLVGLLRYPPWGRERATKMLAAPGSQRQLLPHPTTEPSQRVVLVEGEPDMLAGHVRMTCLRSPFREPRHGNPNGRRSLWAAMSQSHSTAMRKAVLPPGASLKICATSPRPKSSTSRRTALMGST